MIGSREHVLGLERESNGLLRRNLLRGLLLCSSHECLVVVVDDIGVAGIDWSSCRAADPPMSACDALDEGRSGRLKERRIFVVRGRTQLYGPRRPRWGIAVQAMEVPDHDTIVTCNSGASRVLVADVQVHGVTVEVAGVTVEVAGVSAEVAGVSVEVAGVSVEGAGVSVEVAGVSVEGAGVSVEGAGVSVEGVHLELRATCARIGRTWNFFDGKPKEDAQRPPLRAGC
jgi:hypothetical protein